ncbi:MAG TPA: hypothetical protein ENN76_00350 [Euryarchaeota archaeon]|nr:hypothetical protein [Euryarchaeota archaeon]
MVKRIIRIVMMVLGGVALGVVMAFLLGWVVMLLWNWLMPAIFGLPTIGFWKAWGLVILAHILFKAGRHGPNDDGHFHPHPPWKEKFKEKMKRHFGEKPPATEGTDAQ